MTSGNTGADVDVDIVIVSYNTHDLLEQCLRSIAAHAGDVGVRTVVVDNASSDGSGDMVRRRFPEVALVENRRNVGFATANNQGMAGSKGRYILLLNPDTIVLPGAIAATVAAMDRRREAGIATCKVLNEDRSFQACYGDEFPSVGTIVTGGSSLKAAVSSLFLGRSYRASSGFDAEEIGTEHEVAWVMGAFMMIRREVHDAIGGLDEKLFMYGEETDYCYRAANAGWQMWYLPSGSIVHLGGQSTRKIDHAKVIDYLLTTSFYFYEKHHGRLYTLVCYLMAFVVSAAKLAMYGALALLPAADFKRVRRREKVAQMWYTLRWCLTHAPRALGRGTSA